MDRFLLESGSRLLLEDGYALTLESVPVWVRSSATGTNIANPATGVTVTKPTGVVDGDVLYAFIAKAEANDNALFTSTGWTTVLPGTPATTTENDRQIAILRKVITNASGEASSYTFVTTSTTASCMGAIIVAVKGAHTPAPEDVALSTSSRTFGVNSSQPASNDITTLTDNCLILQFCFLALGTVTPRTWVVPTGYINTTNVAETGSASNDIQIGVAHKTQAVAGAVGTNAWGHTSNDATVDYVVAVVAVRAALDIGSGGLLGVTKVAHSRMQR